MNLKEVAVRPVHPSEEQRYQDLMREHHYLGSLPKIGETLWYVASWRDEWAAILSFSAAAWKCAARDRWIGWSFRHQYDRLTLIANNSRFLILPGFHTPNLGTRVLALTRKRLPRDWHERFGHPVLALETFVDPARFQGTVYKADNWHHAGNTKGFRRTTNGYAASESPKMVFVKPLRPDAQKVLSGAVLDPSHRKGGSRIMLSAAHMQSLPSFFTGIPDPRRTQGKRHRLRTVLAIAAGATLLRHEGVQGHLGLGRKPGPEGEEAHRLSL